MNFTLNLAACKGGRVWGTFFNETFFYAARLVSML